MVSCHTKNTKNFVISDKSLNANTYIDEHSGELVKWAANDLAREIEKIIGKEIKNNYTDKFHPEKKGIYIGNFDDKLIKRLPENDSSQLNTKWEEFIKNTTK